MAIMLASKKYENNLYAFVFGYARMNLKQKKQIFSMIPLPFIPVFFIIVIIFLIWFILLKIKKKEEIELKYFLTKQNEGIVISDEEKPGLLNGEKEGIAKLIGVAVDRHVIRQGEVPNHIFFLLNEADCNIFYDEVLDAIVGMHVWIFVENGIQSRSMKKLEKIGKIIFFDSGYMHRCGNSDLILGTITRFLSLIPRGSDTNLDHIYQGIPDKCTISFSYPVDVHLSRASVLKHQKFFSLNHGDEVLQITNSLDLGRDVMGHVKLVKAETEPFFICFREVL